MDFLGLRTLTVIQNAVDEINRIHNIGFSIEDIDENDKEVYKLIGSGKTEGIFQLESKGMKRFMKDLKPESIEDIIAGISLYRPGPMDFIPKYIKGKKGDIKYTHEKLKPILKETYGCIVYQEQVMQIVRDLGGYDLGRSDLVRRAMSKKKEEVMQQERKNFVYGTDEIKGCIKNGIEEKVAIAIFDEMTDFAKYAFNKSHAAAYALIGYQTAWLKQHYKVEFMTALLTSVMDSNTKIAEYINACKNMGIEVLPPDVNESFSNFSVSNNKIRFGLKAIKNVGKNVIDEIVKEREKGKYKGLSEFIKRLEGKDLNKRCVESLILAGAFDSFGNKRSQYIHVYEPLLTSAAKDKKRNIVGQINLFEINNEKNEVLKDELPDVKEFDKRDLLAREKEVLGIYLTGHPLDEYINEIKKYSENTSLDFIINDDEENTIFDSQRITYSGIISDTSIKFTKNNNKMAFLTVEDIFGEVEVIVFPNVFDRNQDKILNDKVVIVKGTASIKEGENAKIICNEILFLEDIKETKGILWLKIEKEQYTKSVMKTLKKYVGNSVVMVYNEFNKEKLKLNTSFNVNICDGLISELENILGKNNIIIKDL